MKKIVYSILASLLLISCGDFDEINLNPDTPSTVVPEFLATGIILKITARPADKWFISDTWLMKSTSFTEHMEWYMYNKFERANVYENYYTLFDAKKMITLVDANETMPEGEKKAYHALNHFIRGYLFYAITMDLGDIPCSDALTGESMGTFSPKYDTQEEVFSTILNELQLASDLFGASSKLNGDPIYKGDPVLWQRTVNSFTLRVLNMLSKKQSVSGADIKSLFEKTASLPLIQDETESFQRVYDASKSAQWFPFYYERQNFWPYPVMTSFFVNLLKDLNDYRLFLYAEPAEELSSAPANSFDAYSGVNPVLEYGQIQAEFTAGKHSTINKRYHRIAQGEPSKFIAYSELQFVLAEAALRGWKTPLSAKEHYENGIKAAMQFTATHSPTEYTHDITIDESYIDSYLKGKAAFNEQEGIQQIMTQKYIAAFAQIPFNIYYDYRRTSYPKIPIDPETNMNEVKTQLPLRWMYPDSEYSQNRENIEIALQRQFGGTDTPNDIMWLLK